MKFFMAIFVAIVLVVGYGSSSVGAVYTPAVAVGSPDLLTGILTGVRTLLTIALSALFGAINNFLLLVFSKLLSLLTLFLPADFTFPLANIVPGLLALKNPTLLTVATVVLQTLKINGGDLVLSLVPVPILNTPIDLNLLLKLVAPFLKGKNLTFGGLLKAVAVYLGTVYSLVLPKIK